MTRGVVVVGRRRLLEHGKKGRVHHARPAVAGGGGETIKTAKSYTAVRTGRTEHRAGGEAGEVGALRTGRSGLDGYHGEVVASVAGAAIGAQILKSRCG